MNYGNKYLFWLTITCFAGMVLFLTFNRHSRSGYFNYHSEIWSDKAGYYVYLPAALKFGFNPDNFPDDIGRKTGNGFILDHADKKVLTKYTCGVAILQLPFFILADAFAKPLGFEANGFSPIYHWSINVAAVFYLLCGLFLLGHYLVTRFRRSIALIVLASVFLATNLYYYSVDETGMSHIYSFALFCIWIFLMQRTNFLQSRNLLNLVLFGIISGLIVLVRPSNVLFLSTYIFLDGETRADLVLRLKTVLHPKTLFPVIAGVFIVMLPQFAYWQYSHGAMINYSYGSEAFNWGYPHLLQTWFAPHNGLFLYTPFYLIIIAAMIYMVTKQITSGVFFLVLFLVISYVFSSWHDWGFGCAFGARSYVEYIALFSIPVAHLFKAIDRAGRMKFIGLLFLVAGLAILNLKMIYSYDGCFTGTTSWDWSAYFNLVTSPTK